jgi:DNA-binding transcriptional regulator YdaS (Cro superfamily)
MTKQSAITYYGSQAALARALGINRAAINAWGDGIPIGRQYQIEVLTAGKLKADRTPQPGTNDRCAPAAA